MHEIELKIAKKDWLVIAVFGISFSVAITLILYFMLQKPLLDGIIFAGLLGSSIVAFSMFSISFLNTKILPFVSPRYWVAFAAVFSFLSGFVGTLLAVGFSRWLDVALLHRFHEHFIAFAAVLGLLTYIIGALLYQFVKMSNQKDYQEKKLYESRLKSLETQLNPHFLFNALNSLAELIHRDKNKAEDALMQLSSFLRSSMKESALVDLAQELQNVRRYVALENIRFDDTITLRVDGNCDQSAITLPKFSVQLLVENALKHGFTNPVTDFHITITLQKSADKTLITVRNSGAPVTDAGFGIGLRNLQERLWLLCGGSVALQSKNPATYLITLGECNENITG